VKKVGKAAMLLEMMKPSMITHKKGAKPANYDACKAVLGKSQYVQRIHPPNPTQPRKTNLANYPRAGTFGRGGSARSCWASSRTSSSSRRSSRTRSWSCARS
jgi:hypothetical protein